MIKLYSNVQKQILQKLLTKFESSKTYKGENSVTQSFSIKPSEVFNEYEKDSADINQIEDFEKLQQKVQMKTGIKSAGFLE